MWRIFLALLLGYGGIRLFLPWLGMILRFPRLRWNRYWLTSLPTGRYNCIGWAAGDSDHWWDSSPDGYWPEGALKGRKIADLVAAFQAVGFVLSLNGDFQRGRQKVALYEDNRGNWTHAAKRLDQNWWSSKLGKNYDISHKDPGDLSGSVYGKPTTYMIK
jgi:hypothetical protein